MKSFKIKLKKGNFITSFRDVSTYGEIELENGRKFELEFNSDTDKVIVTSIETSKEKLTEEERTAIIERILKDCATFLKSILKASISLYLEEYTLVDCTTGEELYTNTSILEEFVNSKYADETDSKTLQALLSMYKELKANEEKIGKEDIEITYPNKLYIIEKADVNYFFTHLFKKYVDEVTLDYKNASIYIRANEEP